jgi:hypothetical protein
MKRGKAFILLKWGPGNEEIQEEWTLKERSDSEELGHEIRKKDLPIECIKQ